MCDIEQENGQEQRSVKVLVAKSIYLTEKSLGCILGISMNTWLQSWAAVCEGQWGVTEESRALSECDEKAEHSCYQKNTQMKLCTRNKKALIEINYRTVQDMM